jgi:hypothetical protein
LAIEILRFPFWNYAQDLDALLARSGTFFSGAAGQQRIISTEKVKKSFAEISEAMHRHSD